MEEQNDFTNRLADARAVYEGTHQLTMSELAEMTGMDRRVLVSQSKTEGWRKIVKDGVTDEARAAAERFATWKAMVSKALSAKGADPVDLANPRPDDPLAKLLEEHRKEWMAARVLQREAFSLRNSNPAAAFERGKLAKLLTEQMDILQRGERRAWGIDDREAPQGSVVVIERGGQE